MRNVYLDYSATTPVKDEVLREMIPYFTENFGNPSSLYTMGLESKEAVETARKRVADLIGADAKEIYFTGCGSEADNWAVFGTADKLSAKGKHIITTEIEHHAMLHSCEFLEKHGFEVTYLKPEADGTISPETLENAVTDQTVLISIMMVNNEVGTIEPIKELAAVAKKHNILFHTDAVQALANVPIDVKELGVDMLSMSAHKIYGPKGIGALYIRKGLRISNYLHGGAQEMGRRAGTENLPGIVGFGKAAELAAADMEHHIAHSRELRDYLVKRITEEIPDTFVNGSLKQRHPGNANITFKYIEGESILLMLDFKGISVSTGSACSSKSLKPSHVLSALGVPVEMIHGTVRFTVGDFTTKEDIDYTVETLKEITAKLRELSPVNNEKGW
ncbi:MAG: cysteine desulfurase NifS [Emergencia sp.]|nr:cysteine desulfurase NifS [Emergencia sp.]